MFQSQYPLHFQAIHQLHIFLPVCLLILLFLYILVFGILTFIQTVRKLEVGETVGRVDAGIEILCTSW